MSWVHSWERGNTFEAQRCGGEKHCPMQSDQLLILAACIRETVCTGEISASVCLYGDHRGRRDKQDVATSVRHFTRHS
jgi:hypothetical protein